jgi:integrase
MKGRPLTSEESERLLKATEPVVGLGAAPSWKYILRGLWESGLRINELMHVSWDNPLMIMPQWREGRHPVLHIPYDMQKNATEESIPLLPWFERLLLETTEAERTGWAFKPTSLQVKNGRKPSGDRPDAEWVSKIISRIGQEAKIIVHPEDQRTKRKAKYASAHDLRRSCGERLVEAGVPETVICRVLRHTSWETTRRHYAPGDVQKEAAVLRSLLKPEVPAKEENVAG